MTTPMTASTSTGASSANSRRVPLDKRKRTETSCDKCKSRKQKCRKEPGRESCTYCIVHNIECQTTQPRKKRLYGSVESLGNRIALLEALVKGLLPEADVSNLDELRQLGLSLGIALPESPDADGDGEGNRVEGSDAEEPSSLLPDQQGQVQFIGPASSFSFHLKLRDLCGSGSKREFVLFGKNAAAQAAASHEEGEDPHPLSTPSATSAYDHSSPGDRRTPAAEVASLESLVNAYFEHINPDFPVLHEQTFREAYEAWLAEPAKADAAWQCLLLCVLLLARRVARVTLPEEQEIRWWKRVQALLPALMFTSSVVAVQALILAATHLHNSNHRDACWNLTGSAVRVAHAIGLHQDSANMAQTPLARELRKRLWWTLYTFEQLQVSSYDRPSAVEHPGPRIGYPNERIIGEAYFPQDYHRFYFRLIVHMGAACRAPKNMKSNPNKESYAGPLSPAARALRDLERWQADLPPQLRIEEVDAAPPLFQRPIIVLHCLFHYTMIVLCRAALLARATAVSKEDSDIPNNGLTAISDSCVESGRGLARLLLKLDAMGKLDAVTWLDMWYTLAASSALVLDLICHGKGGVDVSESRILLSQLADMAQRHQRNPQMPGTIQKFASLIPELHSMADSLVRTPASQPGACPEPVLSGQDATQPEQSMSMYAYPQPNHGAYIFADNVQERFYPEDYAATMPYPHVRSDRNTQMQFMDFTINSVQNWNWADMGNLLGPDISHTPHVVSGPPLGPAPGPHSH